MCVLLYRKPDAELLELFNYIDGQIFQHVAKEKGLRAVFIAPSYVVFYKKRGYLVGIDEDTGKLFINSFSVLLDEEEGEFFIPVVEPRVRAIIPPKISTYGGVEIFAVEDAAVRSGLGYHLDYRGGAVDLSLERRLILRVQGDLLLVAERVSDVRDFAIGQAVKGNESMEIYVNNLFMDRVFGALVEMGFSPRVNTGWSRVRVSVDGIDNAKLKEPLATRLERYFSEVTDTTWGLKVCDPDLGVADLIFDTDSIKAEVLKSYLLIKFVDEAVEAFTNSARRTDVNFMVGNHRVYVKSSLPNTITFSPSIKPVYLGGDRLVISFRELYAFAGETRITLTHPEHARREITFKQDAAVSFRTTDIEPWLLRTRNRLLLRHLLKEPPQSEDIEA